MSETIVFIVMIILVAALILLQVFLSMRRSWWPGLIPMLLAAVLALAIPLTFGAGSGTYKTEHLTGKDLNGNTLEMDIKYYQDGQLISFTPVRLRDSSGALAEEIYLAFDEKGKLIDEDDAVKGVRLGIAEMLGDRKLTGDCVDFDDPEGTIYLGKGASIYPTNWFAVTARTMLPFLLIYAVGRLSIRAKRRDQELKKLQVDSV